MARTRWGADAPEDARTARHQLVDAAAVALARFGVVKTTVEDIAEAAHVSRATVYRYFAGGRDELMLAVAGREFQRYAEERIRKSARRLEFADFVVEAVLFAVRAARDRPVLQMVFTPEKVGLRTPLRGASEGMHAATREQLAPLLERAKKDGVARQDLDVDDAARWVVRMITSLILQPAGSRTADERAFLQEFFLPAFLA